MKKSIFLLAVVPALLVFIFRQQAFAQLSQKEKAGLLFMIEEEKMARDVYQQLSAEYPLPVFRNIAKAEQWHYDLVVQTAKDLDIDLPATVEKDSPGVFKEKGLQKQYEELIARGKQSLVEALKAGALIEEQDISDLRKRIADLSDQSVRETYQCLEQGSHNHLRAFSRQLERRGTGYEPTALSQADFTAIVQGKPTKPKTGACLYRKRAVN